MVMPPTLLFEMLVPVVAPGAVMRRVPANRAFHVMRCKGVINRLKRGISGIERVTDRSTNMDLSIGLQDNSGSSAPAAIILH